MFIQVVQLYATSIHSTRARGGWEECGALQHSTSYVLTNILTNVLCKTHFDIRLSKRVTTVRIEYCENQLTTSFLSAILKYVQCGSHIHCLQQHSQFDKLAMTCFKSSATMRRAIHCVSHNMTNTPIDKWVLRFTNHTNHTFSITIHHRTSLFNGASVRCKMLWYHHPLR